MPAQTLVCRRKKLRIPLQRDAEEGARHRREKLRKVRRTGRAQLRGEWPRTNSRRTTRESKRGVMRVLRRRLACRTEEFSPDKRRWLIWRVIDMVTTL